MEDCFREAKEELGLDHFECRSWRCIQRHLYLVILSHLFCVRVREKFSVNDHVLDGELLSTEQVRRAMNVFLEVQDHPPRLGHAAYESGLARQEYYQRRNAQASKSHRKRREKQLKQIGIAPDRIKSVNVKPNQ